MSLKLYSEALTHPMILGTALYPSLAVMQEAIQAAGVQMVTVSLKRESKGGEQNGFWQTIQSIGCQVLPNTAGCRSADEVVTVAQMAREVFNTSLIKLEVIGDQYTLQPNVFELVEAAERLIKLDFKVLPYCTTDLTVCQKLVNAGCEVLMPLASPIGSGQGVQSPFVLKLLRERFPLQTLIVDAGLGTPSDATQVMELGFDGVLLNSAVALADDPVKMAQAFSLATQAGKLAYEAKRMPTRLCTS